MEKQNVLLLEPFYGGSHKQLMDVLQRDLGSDSVLVALPATKWHWRARTAAVTFYQMIPPSKHYRVLFASSVLNLCELIGLRPDLWHLFKILYFHENQLVYPVRKQQERDFQYGYNQVLSCLTADVVVFNSTYNMESFLSNIKTYFKIMPDFRPKDLEMKIRPKCRVLYIPLTSIDEAESLKKGDKNKTFVSSTAVPYDHPLKDNISQCGLKEIHIVWPHRWEHDKGPEDFFEVLFQLNKDGCQFRVSVIGETFTENPEIFTRAEVVLKDHILNWGYQEKREDYIKILKEADIVVSTAYHEFFGIAMLEATAFGCYPLCPNRLVYPEIFPGEYLYNTKNQLLKRLRYFCKNPSAARTKAFKIDLERFSWNNLKSSYRKILTGQAD